MSLFSNKKLYRIPQQGMIKGVCAGIARYFDVPVLLIRVIAVLSLFFVSIFIIVAYFILAYMLEEAPAQEYQTEVTRNAHQQLKRLEESMNNSEQRLRALERYITSDEFSVRNRFNRL